jgi:hypothetical protein
VICGPAAGAYGQSVPYRIAEEDLSHACQVHQAAGMVSVQGDTDLTYAYCRIRSRARSLGVPAHVVALAVVIGAVRFDD